MTKEELAKVEEIVNDQIAAALPVVTKETTIDEAKKMGAMALFGEKYGSTVRVVCSGRLLIRALRWYTCIKYRSNKLLQDHFCSLVLQQVFAVSRHLHLRVLFTITRSFQLIL